ncbi:MAG: hypothetical protein ABIP74_03110 [Candidatus Saccharimonas sp.]
MRTFWRWFVTFVAAIALGATVGVVAPIQASAATENGLELVPAAYDLYWNNTNSPKPTFCTHVKGSDTKLNLKMSKSLKNKSKMCDFYIVTKDNFATEKTQLDVYKRNKWRVDVKVVLGKKNSVVLNREVGYGTAKLKFTSEPYAMKFQYVGKKNSSWLPYNRYTFRNKRADKFKIGVKYLITATWISGPYKGETDSFISYMFLQFNPKLTK